MYDVVVAGAGVTGAFIARELSKYRLSVLVIEKEPDVAMGSSKANSAIIHAGYDAVPGTLKAVLNVRGNKMMKRISEELDVPFKMIGSLVLCFSEEDLPKLEELKIRGIENGVEGLEIIGADRLREIEPNISHNAVAALYAPSAGIICPYELTLHAMENAVENGAELKLECELTGISYDGTVFHLETTKGPIECRYLVNAAGLYSDTVAEMAGDHSFRIKPRKGEYVLFDKTYGSLVNRVIFQLPTAKGKGILVTPTVDGNLLIGPNAEDIQDKADKATTSRGLSEVINIGKLSVISLDTRRVITSFAGLRAIGSTGDFIIRPSSINEKLIHAAGIESPGLTSAPAIGEMVADLLKKSGLILEEKPDFCPSIEKYTPSRNMSEAQWNEAVKKDPAHGRIVCRCEKVTEADVVSSIRRTIGARNVDAVKRRTRAGMGRCQGGFCSPRIVEILSKELGISFEEVTKSSGKSVFLLGKTK
ncbi:MAG TPA: NAD(P)/FAD-dependent oxidoreductase [Clostridia bacterium]